LKKKEKVHSTESAETKGYQDYRLVDKVIYAVISSIQQNNTNHMKHKNAETPDPV